jgi:hypothetical protein|tara:strand:+ start:1301 stop:1549 length:249 start_codon:yes stop_codon:yes gene_type:complete
MGKASRQLSNARKTIDKELENLDTPTNNIYEYTNTNNNNIDNISLEVQKKLSNFCSKNSYSLCEYLDTENISNFIYYIQNRN